MSDFPDCPSEQLLFDYTRGRLRDEDRSKCASHVVDCQRCRGALDRLASASTEPGAANGDELTGSLPPRGSTPADAFDTQILDDETFDFDVLDPSTNDSALGRMGKYEILEVIGYGGMGVVLRGRDEALRRTVAIKVLKRTLASSALARRRFIREARAAAAVSHANVVTIYAVEEHRGLPLLVMEHVSGCSLRDRLRSDQQLDPIEALRISAQIAAGLAAAHAQGVIHRDIKPGNIMLEDGVARVKITDFGLARAAAIDNVELTSRNLAVGTPAYMAPEQVHGESIDARADLFGLGCVMYAMLAGCSPFHGRNALEMAHLVMDHEPASLSTINDKTPVFYCEVVSRLLRKDPDERFQSAAEVADLLNRFLSTINQTPTDELAAVMSSRPPITSRRTRRAATWSVVALCLFGLLAIGLLYGPGRNIDAPDGEGGGDPSGSSSNAGELAPDTISVAANGQADFRTISAALASAAPRSEIRVLDNATYEEAVVIDRASKWEGVQLVAVAGAVLAAPQPRTLLEIRSTPRVVVQGFGMRVQHAQLGIEITGRCPGLRIEDIEARRVPNTNSQESSPLAFAYVHGRACGTPDEPIVLREIVVRDGDVGIVLGEQFAAGADEVVRHLDLQDCSLIGPSRGAGYQLILMNALEQISVSRNILARGACGVSVSVDRPRILRDVRVEHNTFHDLNALCNLTDSDLQQEGIRFDSNLMAGVGSVVADQSGIDAAAAGWFHDNWWLRGDGPPVPSAAAVAEIVDGVEFESLDPADEHYLRPILDAERSGSSSQGTPGRYKPLSQ